MRRTYALASLLAVSALALLGCGRPDATAGQPRIAVIPKDTINEFWKSIHAGANKVGRERGVQILWDGPLRPDDREGQIRVVENMIAKKVAGIVLAPLDDKALAPIVAEARASGIPVIVIDSDLDSPDKIAYVATDNRRGGELAARRLGEVLGGKGRVAMLRFGEGHGSTQQREEGFLATIAGQFPGITVVSSQQRAGGNSEDARDKAENLLTNHSALDGVFCPNESTTFGMLRALEESGRAGKVRFVGFDATDALLAALAKGHMDGLIVQDPFAMGTLGVQHLLDHLAGRPVPPVVDTGVHLVTAENLESPEMRALLRPDLAKWLE